MPKTSNQLGRNESIVFLHSQGHEIAALAYNEQSSGMPIIFIHGMTASVHFWEAAMYEHIRQNHPWYSLSLPFHFPSRFLAEAEIDEYIFAAILEDCFEQLLPNNEFILIGYSLGGFAALNYAAKYPTRVYSVVSIGGLMNGCAKGLERVLMALSKGKIIRKFFFHLAWRTMSLHPFFLKIAVLFYAKDRRALLRYNHLDETIRQIFPDVKKQPIEKMRQFFRYLIDMDVMDEIDKIQMPVLVIAGDQDPIIPYSHQKKYATALPKGQLLTLLGVGHVPFGERPQKVEAAIVDWVKNT